MDNVDKKDITSKLLSNFKNLNVGEKKVDLLSIAKKISEKRQDSKKKK